MAKYNVKLKKPEKDLGTVYMPSTEIEGKKPGSKKDNDINIDRRPEPLTPKNIKTTLGDLQKKMQESGIIFFADTLKKHPKFNEMKDKMVIAVYDDMGELDRVMDEETGKDIKEIFSPEGEGEDKGIGVARESSEEGMAKGGSVDKLKVSCKSQKSSKECGGAVSKKKLFFGGPVRGDEPSGAYPGGDKEADEFGKFDFNERRQQVMGNKKYNYPSDPKVEDKASFAEGGEVTNRKMSGSQIEAEFGVKKPGDVATVYNVEVKDGKLVNATPDDVESKRFSRIVSENTPKDTAIGDAQEREQASGSYNEKPNVAVASGAGFADGGEVTSETPPLPMADAGAEPVPAEVAEPKVEENMKGPFESYAKVAGMNQQLVRQGDTLFTQIDKAVSSGNPEDAQASLDQLRQFVKDVDNARQDAVTKANDTALAASYKEMANDARDLLTAFENMVAEIKSPEAQAAMPAEMMS